MAQEQQKYSESSTESTYHPRDVLRHGVEGDDLAVLLGALDDRRDELLHEAADLEQGRPEHVQEVDDEALDVRAVVVLIRHHHQVTVAKGLGVRVLLAELQAQDGYQVLDLLQTLTTWRSSHLMSCHRCK